MAGGYAKLRGDAWHDGNKTPSLVLAKAIERTKSRRVMGRAAAAKRGAVKGLRPS